MRIADLQQDELQQTLCQEGIWLSVFPFLFHIKSNELAVATGISQLYADYPVAFQGDYADFHITIKPPAGVRRFWRPQIQFYLDRHRPFKPLPRNQSYAFLEWGMNWCVANHMHRYLILHTAVVEKNGKALLLPGASGAGKSTLCAGLVARGWRLLSDELALIEPESGRLIAFPRPISLKNESVGVLNAFAPEFLIGPIVNDTQKGSVAHAKPMAESVHSACNNALADWIVFPQYVDGSDAKLEPMAGGTAFMQLQEQAFNYQLHGKRGFEVLTGLVKRSDCYSFEYSSLEEGVSLLESHLLGEPLAVASL